PWPKGEYLIAEALDVHPSIIWPSRYFKDGVVVERRELMRRRDLTVNASLQDNEEN
ncbi:helix-turn-helix domain-containing protein, partial [Cronobacter sakazakii]